MNLKEYLVEKNDLPLLKLFSDLGAKGDFEKKLNFLLSIAEQEKWDQTDIHTGYKNSTLYYYILHTFDRCFEQERIFINSDETVSVFNTGLMDKLGNDIYGRFTVSNYYDGTKSKNYWWFKDFLRGNDKEFLTICDSAPKPPSYFNDYNELYFDPELELVLNFDHIYDDNLERLPESLVKLGKEIAIKVFEGFLGFTLKRIKRNNRIPVPQFYDGKISFLIPVTIFNDDIVVIAVEKINNQYRGSTVLTMGMAYNCARLLTKPESNWLLK